MTRVFISIVFLLWALLAIPMTNVWAALSYNGGTYTNLCGTGTAATADTCNAGCNTATGSCTSNSPYVVKWTCDGNLVECRSNPSGYATSQSVTGTSCAKTVQIDVFDKVCSVNGSWTCSNTNLLDYIVWYSGDCRVTPTPTPTPTPTHTSSCDELRIVSGNNSVVPATVTLRGRGSDNSGSIQAYRFYFGDGGQQESTSAEVSHRYETSGTFNSRADVKDSTGNWKTSSACETTVTVSGAAIESHRSGCSDVFITQGNNTQAPATAKFMVTGYDNKAGVKRYKMDFGLGFTKESDSGDFEQRYEKPGTYTVRGYILDSQNNWHGGTGSCERSLYLRTTTITTQPKTGTPTGLTVAAMASGGLGVLGLFLRKRLRVV